MIWLLEIMAGALLGIVVVVCSLLWWRRRPPQRDKYDLNALFDKPEEEPDTDFVDEDSGPYCSSCDECYAPGTLYCRGCGRSLC